MHYLPHTICYSLRENIAIIPQDTVLFNESLEYNIGYGNIALVKVSLSTDILIVLA